MGNSWKHAQTLQFPQSGLCECGHERKHHSHMKGYCWRCPSYGRVVDMTDPPPYDVFGYLVGERKECERFRPWSVERVRRFWNVANIALSFNTNTEQTLLDDYHS